ncbi:hypothetical protein [Synechococcus sp. GFB01]|uniref:hypothetical protein n=1 Tax=Synechococcus sp. GFB01 TaxID=1662190 RepID=UPI00128C504D|nr:hypothetical protein [Synechococcus sp. GFB01]
MSSGQADAAGSNEQTANEDQLWRGNVELYMLAPLKLDTTTTVKGRTAEADLDLGEVLSALQWYSSLRASVEQAASACSPICTTASLVMRRPPPPRAAC